MGRRNGTGRNDPHPARPVCPACRRLAVDAATATDHAEESRISMTDIERQAEHWLDRAAQFAQDESRKAWAVGIVAAQMVGKYERYGTKAIADRTHRHESTIENYAHAVWMYRDLRELLGNHDAHTLRNFLTTSHFWTAWELQRKYGRSAETVARWLLEMVTLEAQGEPHSAEVLRAEVEASQGGGKAVTWGWLSSRLLPIVQDILALPDAPGEVRYGAIAIMNFYGGTMQNLVQFVLNIRLADGGIIARNEFQASAIVNGCRLWECETDEDRRARVLLYRAWRDSGIFGKATEPCFAKAIAGEAVPVTPMFDGAMVSEDKPKE